MLYFPQLGIPRHEEINFQNTLGKSVDKSVDKHTHVLS